MSNEREGVFGKYYGSFFSESGLLTSAEQERNALYIAVTLKFSGWTNGAIAAIIGNMTAESGLNPGRWQSDAVNWLDGGYGLVQWTPATKYISWCTENGLSDPSEMDANLARIIYEVSNGLQWIPTSAYNLTFSEFTKSSDSPSKLAKAFLLNYERPADQSETVQAYRGALADYWYTFLFGESPPIDPPKATRKKKGYKFVLFGNKQWRNKAWLS